MRRNLFFINIVLLISLTIVLIILVGKTRIINEMKISRNERNTEYTNQLSANKEDILNKNKEIETLSKEIKELKDLNNSLIEKNKELEATIDEISTLSYTDEWLLNNRGIDDFTVITEDLYKHPELLPFEGVLGGTMSFGPVYLINERWVYSNFSDGHIQGYGLYEYTLDDNQEISWRFIDGRLYED